MAQNSQSGGRRGTESRSNPALVPGLIALVLIVVAVAVAVLNKRPKDADNAAEAPKPRPFADMPPEAAPPPKEHKAGSNLPNAPDSITSEPAWISAKALAAEARTLYDATVEAKGKGDMKLANEKGIAAREKYDEAVTMTADWEETILSQYNEYDSKVKAIKDARSDWFNKLLWLKKSVGH